MQRCLATAIRLILAGSVITAAVPATVRAEPAQQTEQQAVDFSIAPQSLSTALVAFGQQAKVQVLTAGSRIEGQRSAGVSGRMSPAQALAKLLQGSGFSGQFSDERTVVVKPVSQSQASQGAAAGESAATAGTSSQSKRGADEFEKITVLGSLIPRSQIETASPVIKITSEEIKARGYTSVADALQQASFNTGSSQNTAQRSGDTWGAKTVSMFGLLSSYTKFLLNGRPMATFSPLAQNRDSTELITNLTGIPIDMVDRIEILTGAQSSLYGSDAIAGVVNIVLKKNVDSASVSARYSGYSDGGGKEKAFSAIGAINRGNFHLMASAQFSKQDPVWSSDREMSSHTVSGDPDLNFWALNLFTNQAVILDPSATPCSNLHSLWGGTMVATGDALRGRYCGSPKSYQTLINRNDLANVSARASYDLNPHLQVYSDLYYSRQSQAQNTFQQWASPVYVDQNSGGLFMVFRQFAPEETVYPLNNKLRENNLSATVGVNGSFGTGWVYDVSVSHSGERAKNTLVAMRNGNNTPLDDYLMGPSLGLDPIFYLPAYAPDYSRMYSPIPKDIIARSLASGSITSSSRNDGIRALVTGDSLFSLPGGNAGVAFLLEGGHESWDYTPDQAFRTGELYGVVFNPSGGSQNRAAAAMEWRLPVLKWLTLSPSARYDRYDAEGSKFSKPTYSLGIEVRPFESLLLRGKYATAFKAPSLADQFEGVNPPSTAQMYDYANCERTGNGSTSSAYNPTCSPAYSRRSAIRENIRNNHLKPITTTSWSYGLVYSPTGNFSASLDYQHLDIRNEVIVQTPDSILLTEAWCLDGKLDQNSPSCQSAFAAITRGAPPAVNPQGLLGPINSVQTGKINLAREINESVTASLHYRWKLQQWGVLTFDGGYTNVMTHDRQIFTGDPQLDYLRHPGRSTEFRTRGNASVTWDIGNWSSTLYASRFGRTPNNAAVLYDGYPAGTAADTIAPWTLYNASVSWHATPKLQVSFRVNNLLNTMPHFDGTQAPLSHAPYNETNYNVLGRWLSLEAKYQFGGGKSAQ